MGLSASAVHNLADDGWPCEICRNKTGNKVHAVREMMLGFREAFQYLECASCGCLQLLDPPQDMTRYYPADYTAFHAHEGPKAIVLRPMWRYLRKQRNEAFVKRRSCLHRLLTGRYDYLQLRAFARLGVSRTAHILDVGCGSGKFLADLKELGYQNLLGVDRFIPQSIACRNGVRIVNETLEHLVGTTWDVITFHHSLEHMSNPVGVLQLTANVLAPGGRCLIRIPVVGWAWEHYGVNWGQLDAPRHLFLHTGKSFRLLASAAGFKVHEVTYDSTEFQFWVSELYSRDIPLVSVDMAKPQKMFSRSQMRDFRTHAASLNLEERGDSAVFELVKL
jgi:SAM-dependent methyltransferase